MKRSIPWLVLCLSLLHSSFGQTVAESDAGREGIPIRFRQDFIAGSVDNDGEFMGGTELMRLVAHEGSLFAGNSYWTDQPGDDPRPGAQILVKKGPDLPWQVSQNFPRSLRISAMESVTFTVDHSGTSLKTPVNVLVADAGLISSRSNGPLHVHTYDKARDQWEASIVSADAPRAFVRAFGFHRDVTTGKEFLFAGTGGGKVYRGFYDPEAPGRLKWQDEPEYSNPDFDGGAFMRCQGFCVANGKLYTSIAPRLLKRVDGKTPEWVEVFRWNPEERAGAGLRGITAVPALAGDHEVILGSREQEGRILRIDPLDEYAVTDELLSREFLNEKLGRTFRGGKLVAYNRFIPGNHPGTGEPIHWVTVAGVKNNDRNAAWLLIRHADASYEPVRVFDETLGKNHPFLATTRTLEFAPWSESEFYTGGFDGAANGRKNHNTAWVFRGNFSPRLRE